MGHSSTAVLGKHERGAFLAVALLLLAYVAMRAATMPWVHDECASLFWYVERGEWLPGLAHWDANNHVLSTVIGLLSYKLVGLSLLGSRIGSVLAFLLFAWAAWRLGQRVERALVRWAMILALLLCPFLLDFFSLFRGYGLQMAFWLMALDGALAHARDRSTNSLIRALLALVLANAAVLALLPLWAAMVVFGLYFVLRRRPSGWKRHAFLVIMLGAVPVMLGAWLSVELKQRGLLYHGTLEGFVSVSIGTLCTYVLGAKSLVLAWVIMAMMAATLCIGVWLGRRDVLIVSGLFWADAALRIVMALMLGVNYPEDRAALHLVPLMVLAMAFSADALAARTKHASWLILPLLFLPLRSSARWLLDLDDRTLLWPEQQISRGTVLALNDYAVHVRRPAVLGAYHQTCLSVPYAMRVNGLGAVVPMSEGFPGGDQDMRLADERFLARASVGYAEVDSWSDHPRLLQRKESLSLLPIAEQELSILNNDAEFIELLHPDTLEPGVAYAIELDAAVTSDGYMDLHLVIELGEEEGLSGYRDDVPFALFRPQWNGERLHVIRTFTSRSNAARQVIYLWNPTKQPVKELRGALRLLRRTDG